MNNPYDHTHKERDYWLEKLSGQIMKTVFPPDEQGESGKNTSFLLNRFSFQLVDPLFSQLLKVSNNSPVRLHILLTAGWLMLLHRYTGNTDIIIGAPAYRQEVEGELVNTVLALRCRVTGNTTVKELLMHVGQTILEADKHQNYPIHTLVYKLNLPDTGKDFPLFDLSVLLEGIHERTYLDRIRQNMIVSFNQDSGSLTGVIEYNGGLYSESTINRIAGHFTTIMESALSDVNTPVSNLELISRAEREEILTRFNTKAPEFVFDKTVWQYVDEFALRTPEATALIFEGIPYTYKRVGEEVNRLSLELQQKGVGEDCTVGILMERSPMMAESILAVWKAGGAYIPLDISYPVSRLVGILEDSSTRVLLADFCTLPQGLSDEYKGIILDPNTIVNTATLPAHRQAPGFKNMESLAYVIYTSGSTGKPKGAMVEHIGMMNHMQVKIKDLQITSLSVIAQNASHTFDISVWQYFSALVKGGKTAIYSDAMILDPVNFMIRMSRDGVTILEVVPSYLHVMLEAIGGEMHAVPWKLSYLLVTGEEVKPYLVNRWFQLYPFIKMVNAYGPTEASDDITHHVMAGPCSTDSIRVPIGKPIFNLEIVIVDSYEKLCPVGVKGELWVAGIGVGRGYLNRTQLTSEKFVSFVHDKSECTAWDAYNKAKANNAILQPSERSYDSEPPVNTFYKTGDLGSWRADGAIDFFGRIDFQVKIRGFRIELGEIENCLLQHPRIDHVVVIDREDTEKEKFLCAYVVVKKNNEKVPDIQELKKHLDGMLPDYMIPAHFVFMDKLPLTANGKIDRKALPEPHTHGDGSSIPFVDAEMMEKWIDQYNRLRKKKKEEVRVFEDIHAPKLSEEERNRILHEFNATEVPFPLDFTLYRLFEEQVEKTPDNIAVNGPSLMMNKNLKGSSFEVGEVYLSRIQITYGELNKRANRLARFLSKKGAGKETIIGIMSERCLEMEIAILAVLKTGGTYMPIAPTFPDKRIEFMITDTAASFILTDGTREIPGKQHMMIPLANESVYDEDGSALSPISQSTDAAGIFFTSGSTGMPKGVILEHRGLVNRLWWMKRLYPLDTCDAILQKTPFIFDVSMWELFYWMFQGASLYFLDPMQGDKPEDIYNAIMRGRVTHVHIPPAFQIPFLDYLETTGKVQNMRLLKRVFASGEALIPAQVDMFNRLLYKTHGTRLYNLYGPTEASIEVSYFDCTSDKPVDIVLIGKPIDNVDLVIVDKDRQLMPVGEVGELCIGGTALARGYLNRPELTLEKFVAFGDQELFYKKVPELPKMFDKSNLIENSCGGAGGDSYKKSPMPAGGINKIIYRTGDYARFLPDGNIEFLGRIDRQVQLQGIRIELGEIENALLKHKDIKEAAVVACRDEKKDREYLCAFVHGHGSLEYSDFKEVISRELPHFMLPSQYIEIKRMPLTATGKIDRNALQEIARTTKPGDKMSGWENHQGLNELKPGDKGEYSGDFEEEVQRAVLNEEEKNRVLNEFNDTDAGYPKEKTIVSLFEEAVEKYPDSVALTINGSHVTYRRLNEISTVMAFHLMEKGVVHGTIVGMMMERSVEMIALLMAVMKLRAIYLPIGLEFPPERIRYMIEDCNTSFFVTHNPHHKKNPPFSPRGIQLNIIHIDELIAPVDGKHEFPVSHPEDPIHILYTSGTTGNPKGVILCHRNIVRLLFNDRNPYDFSNRDVWSLFHEYFFDVSVWEMFGALLYGGRLAIVPDILAPDTSGFVSLIQREQVTILCQTPSNFYRFIDVELPRTAIQSALRYVIFAGESLKPLRLKKWKEKYPFTKLINMYGITETTVHDTFKEIGEKEIETNMNNIGKPLPTLKIYLLDKHRELVPQGQTGEIFVSGDGLAIGYLNKPDLTIEKFIIHPELGRLYSSGDLGRWTEEGEIEFQGRKDHQIQLGGIRIEPGEIESLLLKYPGVDEAVVVVRLDEENEKYLRAILVCKEDISRDHLRMYLAHEIPQYLIPSEFIRLETMPLGPTGKAYRKILEYIEIDESTPEVEFIAPKTPLESRIADIWKQVLKLERIGINDNFFDIGGNSLGIIQVNLKLKEMFRIDIPALIMFEYPTIALMEKYLEQKLAEENTGEPGETTEEEIERSETKNKGRDRMQERRSKMKRDRLNAEEED